MDFAFQIISANWIDPSILAVIRSTLLIEFFKYLFSPDFLGPSFDLIEFFKYPISRNFLGSSFGLNSIKVWTIKLPLDSKPAHGFEMN